MLELILAASFTADHDHCYSASVDVSREDIARMGLTRTEGFKWVDEFYSRVEWVIQDQGDKQTIHLAYRYTDDMEDMDYIPY